MIELFINIAPRHLIKKIDEILKVSLSCNETYVSDGYLWDCVFDRLALKQTINQNSYLNCHGNYLPIWLTYDPNDRHQDACLSIDVTNVKMSLKAIISQFFTWTSIKSRNIMYFDDC